MKKIYAAIVAVALIWMGAGWVFSSQQVVKAELKSREYKTIKLPEPKYTGKTSIEEALSGRRSIRAYKDEPMKLSEVSQLLWAAQGINDTKRGFRTAPSAGALYPLELYVVIGNVEGIPRGVYRYKPGGQELVKVKDGDVRDKLVISTLGQAWAGRGAIIIVFSGVYERIARKYGSRSERYMHIEVGHAAQNVFLQAVSLGLGAGVIGAFRDEEVRRTLNIPEEEHPLYIMPVGKV